MRYLFVIDGHFHDRFSQADLALHTVLACVLSRWSIYMWGFKWPWSHPWLRCCVFDLFSHFSSFLWSHTLFFRVLSFLWAFRFPHGILVWFHMSHLCLQGVFSTMPRPDFQLLFYKFAALMYPYGAHIYTSLPSCCVSLPRSMDGLTVGYFLTKHHIHTFQSWSSCYLCTGAFWSGSDC